MIMAGASDPHFSRDLVHLETANLHRRLDKTNRLLMSSQRNRQKSQNSRDRLARQLQAIEDQVEKALWNEIPKRSVAISNAHSSRKDSLHSFLQWRSQLEILNDALIRSINYSIRMCSSPLVLQDLQGVKDEVEACLMETDGWTEIAEEKLRELYTTRLQDSPTQSLREIVREAEKVRSISMATSLELKAEVKALRNQCVEMAKDLVAMNRILEGRKRQLATEGMQTGMDCWKH